MSDELRHHIMKAIGSINAAMIEVSKVSSSAAERKHDDPLRFRANRIWHELHRAATDLRDSSRSLTEGLPVDYKTLLNSHKSD